MQKGPDHNDNNQDDLIDNEKIQESEKTDTSDVVESDANQHLSGTEQPARTGKRPRIRKPLFSVSFLKE